MTFFKIILCVGWLLALQVTAEAKFDMSDKINGVTLQSGKKKDSRTYVGRINETFAQNLESVKQVIISFADKCNNSYRDRRKFTDKKFVCKYHNDHLVETQVIRKLKSGWKKEPNEVDRFLLARQIFNRSSFNYYELVRIYEYRTAENKKVVKVVQTMLNDKQVKTYTNPLFKKDSAFDKTVSTFVMTELSPSETSLSYEYMAETEHWILNKEVSVPQVFSSISKSINDLVKTVNSD